MVQAYILVQTEVGRVSEVTGRVREIPGVDEAHDVTGPYDLVVRASAEDIDALGSLVVARLQRLEGISRTLTCPIVNI